MTIYEPLILSAKLSALSSVCLLIIAIPLAYVLSYKTFRGKFLIESLVGLPLVVPPTVLGFYLLFLMSMAPITKNAMRAGTGSNPGM